MPNAGVTLLVASLSLASAPKAPEKTALVLRVLKSRYPDVQWHSARPITAELTGDGEADLAVTGSRGADFAVAVVVGPVRPQSEMLRLIWPVLDRLASVDCSRNAAPALVAEPVTLPLDLWGCARGDSPPEFCARVRQLEAWLREAGARGMQGLLVTGVNCEDVHLHWNPQSKQFDYWTAK